MTATEQTIHELAAQVRELLGQLGDFAGFAVRPYGQHILVETRAAGRTRDRDAVARLTFFGHDAFGLSFREPHGGWGEIVLIGALEELVPVMTDALATTPSTPQPSQARSVTARSA
jgi:hypothetical protein